MTGIEPTPPKPITPLPGQDWLLLAARVLLGLIFVISGFGKLTHFGTFTDGMAASSVPFASLTAPVGVAVEFLGGLALMLGLWTRLAAVGLALFIVAATLIAHRFWQAGAEEQMLQQIQFMKNLAIIGGMLAVTAVGGDHFAVDHWWRRSR